MKIGPNRSKCRSLGQVIGNLCVYSRRLLFRLRLMKFGWNVCLDDTVKAFKPESHWIKSRSLTLMFYIVINFFILALSMNLSTVSHISNTGLHSLSVK